MAENGEKPQPTPEADVPFVATVKPNGYKVSVQPKNNIVRLRLTFPVGVVDVVLEGGKELDAMVEDLKAASLRARSDLVIGGPMKGIAGT